METRTLGRFKVTAVGLGCNNFGMRCDEQQTKKVVDAALEVGINFFDTADIYGNALSEEYLGKAIGKRRDEVVIATKFNLNDKDVSWIPQAIDNSLRRLGTDRVDLYQHHFPAPHVPIEDTMAALTKLVDQGKVLEFGCSNYSAEQIDEAMNWGRFVSAQNHYNLLNREPEPEVIEACKRHGLGMIPYFPLASGMLTGKYHRGEPPPEGTRLASRTDVLTDERFDVVERLEKYAADKGHSMLELAISWLAARPTVASVIAGATKAEQVKANAAAANWKLDRSEVAEVEGLLSR